MKVTQSEIDAYLARCRGKAVTRVWKGYGSALFLELGRLSKMTSPKGKSLGAHGQITLALTFEWRIERPRSILVGSADTAQRILNQIPILKGTRLNDVTLAGRLPELELVLSDNLWLKTSTQWKGQPEWAISFYEDNASMFVERGHVVLHKDTEGWPHPGA
jgi:hypothetical protein